MESNTGRVEKLKSFYESLKKENVNTKSNVLRNVVGVRDTKSVSEHASELRKTWSNSTTTKESNSEDSHENVWKRLSKTGIKIESTSSVDDSIKSEVNNIKIIYESKEEITSEHRNSSDQAQNELTNEFGTDNMETNLAAKEYEKENKPKKNSEFNYYLFKMLKLLLTAKCYCVLIIENKDTEDEDTHKLMSIFYQLNKIALKKLITIDYDIQDAKLNDFLLTDLYTNLCKLHAEIIQLTGQLNQILSDKKINKKLDLSNFFERINLIVSIISSIQRILCLSNETNDPRLEEIKLENEIKMYDNDKIKCFTSSDSFEQKLANEANEEFKETMKSIFQKHPKQLGELRNSFHFENMNKYLKRNNLASSRMNDSEKYNIRTTKSQQIDTDRRLITTISDVTFQSCNSIYNMNNNNSTQTKNDNILEGQKLM